MYWGRPQAVSPHKACLITNPAAGPAHEKPDWRVIAGILREAGWWVAREETGGPGSAGALAGQAVADGSRMVVVAGGDGTINEAVQSLVGSDSVLGIIPVGTANVLARELKIPLDPVSAARVLVSGGPRAIDLGLISVQGERPRYFCEMVGIGFDAALMHGILPEVKQVLGKGAYVVSAVSTSFTHRPARVRLAIDGKRLSRLSYMLIIANTALYADDFLKITPDASVDDGLLTCTLFRSHSFWKAWWHFLGVALGRAHEMSDVERFDCRRVEIRGGKPTPIQVDGDLSGTTPSVVEIVPRALRVMVP
jgi:YegS/Rv2252/BmrU family lipid kinase